MTPSQQLQEKLDNFKSICEALGPGQPLWSLSSALDPEYTALPDWLHSAFTAVHALTTHEGRLLQAQRYVHLAARWEGLTAMQWKSVELRVIAQLNGTAHGYSVKDVLYGIWQRMAARGLDHRAVIDVCAATIMNEIENALDAAGL